MATLLHGLYIGLDSANADMLSTMVQLIGELQAPLQGMALAFATSLLGLMGSLFIGIEIVIINRTLSSALDDLNEWFTQLIDDAHAEKEEAKERQEQALLLAIQDLGEQIRYSGAEQKDCLERIIALEQMNVQRKNA